LIRFREVNRSFQTLLQSEKFFPCSHHLRPPLCSLVHDFSEIRAALHAQIEQSREQFIQLRDRERRVKRERKMRQAVRATTLRGDS
jgi:hypothetical protein